jgi:hypothetical protein
MASVAAATRHTYVDRESLNHALTSDLVGWTVSETREAPLLTHVVPHRLGDIRPPRAIRQSVRSGTRARGDIGRQRHVSGYPISKIWLDPV